MKIENGRETYLSGIDFYGWNEFEQMLCIHGDTKKLNYVLYFGVTGFEKFAICEINTLNT